MKQYHHPLLHKKNVPNVRASISSMTENSEALLPVISASIGGGNGLYKHANVLLDSGAQTSLIRLKTAEILGLEGKCVSVTITKVGGEEEEMMTKVFQVQVTSLDNQKNIHSESYRYSSDSLILTNPLFSRYWLIFVGLICIYVQLC